MWACPLSAPFGWAPTRHTTANRHKDVLMKLLFIKISIILVFFASGCSTVSNISPEIDTTEIPLIKVDSVSVEDKRENIDKQRYVDIPWASTGGLKSELYTKIDVTDLKSKIESLVSQGDIKDGALKVSVLDARQGFTSNFFAEKELVWVELQFLLEKKESKLMNTAVCYYKSSQMDADADDVREKFDQAVDCAIRKGISQLNSSVEISNKDNEHSDEIFPDMRISIDKDVKISVINKANESDKTGVLNDTLTAHSNWKTRLYYVTEIDQEVIDTNSLSSTRKASLMTGYHYHPRTNSYVLPAGKVNLKIKAQVFIAMPYLAILSDDSDIVRDICLNVEEGETYFIRGNIDREIAEVWIENSKGEVVAK